MNICEANQAVGLQVLKFMQHVSDIKEESITDFLAWQWRELDKRFNYLSMHTFNHDEESSLTGADFDLELWLVGRRTHVCLAVQAKKVIKQHDSYVKRLNYPNGSKQQLNTLLNYSAANNKLPFYFLYSIPKSTSKFMCGGRPNPDGGVFMADASRIEEFADGKHGKRISRDHLLAASNPFHCIFCCPLGPGGRYFANYFRASSSNNPEQPNDQLPNYVTKLLAFGETEQAASSNEPGASNEGWSRFKAVGVYDMRNDA